MVEFIPTLSVLTTSDGFTVKFVISVLVTYTVLANGQVTLGGSSSVS